MRLDYTTQHWGTPPSGDVQMRWPSASAATKIGELQSISYVTAKDEHATYEHQFELHDGWRASLLRVGRGAQRTHRVGRRLVALGRVVDLTLCDGRVYHPTMLWVCTSPKTQRNGGPVILAGRHEVPFAIEHAVIAGDLWPCITPHGIEG
jgi:hypothetical protein